MIKFGTQLTTSLESTDEELLVEPEIFLHHTLVLGARGAGKTTLGLHLLGELVS